jgi:hypothetical protein
MYKKIVTIFILMLMQLHVFSFGISTKNIRLLPHHKWGEILERPSRWSYGGVFGLNFIQDGFLFAVSPTLTFRAHQRVFLGISGGFNYMQQKERYYNTNLATYEKYTLQSTYYDNSFFMRWFCAGLKFIQIEPGFVNFKNITRFQFDPLADKVVVEYTRKTIPYLQCGAGFVVPFADEKFIIIRCMYDVLQNKESPYYGLPIIRGGINIGI